jgi:predicted site-specific integrase-resolvase
MISATTDQSTNSMPREEVWVTITRYADIHGVSRPTVYKWLDAGLLVVYRVDGVVRVLNQPPDRKTA